MRHLRFLPSRLVMLIGAIALLAACASPSPPKAGVTLAVAQIDRGVMVWLPDNVLFEFGKADIDEREAAPYLDRIAQLLKDKTNRPVVLEGHSDSVGNDTVNLALSEKRAQNVRNALLARGLPADRLTARGYGKSRPLAPNDTELGRKLNRRVELIVLGETVEQLSAGEPVNAFEAAFDKLRRQLEQPSAAGQK
ncbi:OmpA family protein [uncultured Dechloromonas sp.]|uniref:OmpA family protein n=1 Tax=uncultured Dechloromonas sp. TaxID=171719 RepID=UPI0025F67311|nr:OmpA family protein [uncultured Dechloromonas sp.]